MRIVLKDIIDIIDILDITDIIEELKVVVPWAECASPLVGSMAPARYNAYSQTATISDSNKIASSISMPGAAGGEPTGSDTYKLNSDGIGEKPARKYEHHDLKVADAFSDKNEIRFNNVNRFSYNYVPTSYSNSAKGSFSIPNVGAHVWMFFAGGNPNNPVYFATTYGEAEWRSIYNSDLDYNLTNWTNLNGVTETTDQETQSGFNLAYRANYTSIGSLPRKYLCCFN